MLSIRSSASLAVCLFLLLTTNSAQASLLGANVSGCLNRDSNGGCSPFVQGTWDNASATVADPGVEFTGDYYNLLATANFSGDTLVFSLLNNTNGSSSPAPRTVAFQFTNAPTIIDFHQIGGSLTPSFITFTGNSILFQFSSVYLAGCGATKSASFSISTAAVPEPFSAGLLSVGLLGFARLRRTRG